MAGIDYTGDPRATLCHFNPNHDPRNGQFTKAKGGILSRSFGAAKYQNPDGSLTAAGEARLAREKKLNAQKKKDNRLPEDALNDPTLWAKQDTERRKGVVDATKQLTTDLSKLEDVTRKSGFHRFDLTNMTESELQERIRRMNLEDQYNRLMSDRENEVKRGREVISNVLTTAGQVLAVTSSSLAIALAVKQLRG